VTTESFRSQIAPNGRKTVNPTNKMKTANVRLASVTGTWRSHTKER